MIKTTLKQIAKPGRILVTLAAIYVTHSNTVIYTVVKEQRKFGEWCILEEYQYTHFEWLQAAQCWEDLTK